MKKKVFLIVLLLVLCWGTGIAAANKVVLFIVDGVSWQEWQQVDVPSFNQLVSQGAVGLMNAKTADDLDPVDTYLTIGSGDRAYGSSVGKLSFNRYETWRNSPAEDVYYRQIGDVADSTAIVNISLAQLRRANQQSSYQAQVGNLGSVLLQENLKISVLGNADTGDDYRRQIALLAINKYGVINQGDIGRQTNRLVRRYPSQYLTNKSYLIQKFKEYYSTSDLIIVESGATSRLEAVKNQLLPQKFSKAKKEAIGRVDSLLGAVKAELDLNKDFLIVLAPTPAKDYLRLGYKLSWIVIAGPKINRGLLSSGTTKQQGLVANLDILPTIYNYLVAEPQLKFTGQAIKSIARANKCDYLSQLNQAVKTIFSWRPLVVKQFIALQILILLLISCSLLLKDKLKIKSEILVYSILLINWLPLWFLLSRLFTPFSLSTTLLLWVGSSFFLTWLSLQFLAQDNFITLMIPNFFTAGILIIDLWTGGKLLKVSILGYSPVIGARYYGLGNEYLGLLIGITIVLVTLIFELKNELDNRLLFLVCSLLVITIAAPSLGANFGGLIAAVFISLMTYYYLNDIKFKSTPIIRMLLGGVILIISIVLFDILTGAQSHFARLFINLRETGLEALWIIIARKLAINLRLLKWTIWTKVLLAFVLMLVILFKHPYGLTAQLVKEYPFFSSGFKALLWGSLVAGVVNDSGVVVVATLLLVPVFTLVYLVLAQNYFPKEGNRH